MQVKLVIPALVAAISIGCINEYSGNRGEIQKLSIDGNEFILYWEKPTNEKSDTIIVKLSYKTKSIVRREFAVAGYDKLAMPKFTMTVDRQKKTIIIKDAFESVFQYEYE